MRGFGSTNNGDDCVACVAGSNYTDETGTTPCKAVTDCAERGLVTQFPVSSTANRICGSSCLPGFGSYVSGVDGPSCNACVLGSTFRNGTGTGPCKAVTDCAGLGKETTTPASATGDRDCGMCLAGFGSTNGGDDCVACVAGTNFTGQAGTLPCQPLTDCTSRGLVTLFEGNASTDSDCGLCLPGFGSLTDDGIPACSSCALGSTFRDGTGDGACNVVREACPSGLEYETTAPTLTTDRVCANCTFCA